MTIGNDSAQRVLASRQSVLLQMLFEVIQVRPSLVWELAIR